MAADVNNSGWITSEDRDLIKAYADGNISDLSAYNKMDDYKIRNIIKNL